MSKNDITLYKYISLKHATDIIEKQRLYLNDGKNTNDPFEVVVIDKNKLTTRLVEGLHILCLTNSFQNRLMWSHYAESNRGVCLTVKVPQSLVYNICYISKRIFEDSNLDGTINKCIATMKKAKKKPKIVHEDYSLLNNDKKISYIKSSAWKYEKEYRIVFDKDDEKPFTDAGLLVQEGNKWFIKVKITNVYLGVNFDNNSAEVRHKIIHACERNGIQTTQMILSNSDYSLRVGEKQKYKNDMCGRNT